jgi:hypothetical protein
VTYKGVLGWQKNGDLNTGHLGQGSMLIAVVPCLFSGEGSVNGQGVPVIWVVGLMCL